MKKTNRFYKGISLFLVMLMMNFVIFVPDSTYAAAKTVNLKGTYHATLGIQTCDTLWIQRWGYYDSTINPQYKKDAYNKLFSGSATAKNYAEYKGTFADAKIAGNGTYTVSLKGADFAGETAISQLHVATDIPNNTKIKFTKVKVTVNKKTIISMDKGYMENQSKYLSGGMVLLAINHWREPLEKIHKDKGLFYSTNGGITCLTGTGNDTIQITFTVSGFSYNKKK